MDKRKTTDNVVSRPSTRISRLVQPRKYSCTPHGLNRNRSSSTENIQSYDRGANKRSRSANPQYAIETPLKPIARSLSSLFTPASISKNVIPKKPMNEQNARILEILRTHHFGPNFLPSGLQSMTAKQFVEIIRFFACSICGNKIVIQDNNIDDVKRFVEFVQYPLQMNKSWFKTPTLSVAFDRNVEFLDWLCDFIAPDDGNALAKEMAEVNGFGDQQFSARFIDDVTNGYVIFNSDVASESQNWVSKWTDELITCKTGAEDIAVTNVRLQEEYQNLLATETTFAHEELLQTQLKKRNELCEMVAQMEAKVDEEEIDFQERSNELNLLTAKRRELIETVDELKATIKKQNVSAEDRKKMVFEMKEKEGMIEEKKTFVASSVAIADENAVKIARLKIQKTAKIFALNVLMQKVFQLGINIEEINLSEVSINETDNKDEIRTKLKLFDRIKEFASEQCSSTQILLNDIQTKVTSATSELFKSEDEIAYLKKHLHSLEVQIQKVDDEIVDENYATEQQRQQKQTEIEHLLHGNDKLIQKIENSEKMAETLKDENRRIFIGIQVEADGLLKEKIKQQSLQESALQELEQLIGEVKNAIKNLK
ncbi:hypothetical protein Bhyg_06758 [Pseudolycoriella hygida]|uniref:Kinetochore protein NDC80 n=1 Tax=Pseudolycoriella hygida TaxID=35572 RepID=A0A9Q0S359_9DIPT|nr:hypothetical protein Bhyg_06758 [Pseudolycoriella hygida]